MSESVNAIKNKTKTKTKKPKQTNKTSKTLNIYIALVTLPPTLRPNIKYSHHRICLIDFLCKSTDWSL